MLKIILFIEPRTTGADTATDNLRRNCKKLHCVKSEADALGLVMIADVAVIHAPAPEMLKLQHALTGTRKLPIFWLNSFLDKDAKPEQEDWGFALDGLLFPTMRPTEMGHALSFGIHGWKQRKRWAEEKESLSLRLEERKWIDQAKAVLSEIKGISENEAYDFLRKQAMNERKRIGEVAANIVKVYQLIHG
jgi:response regulator NasT